MQENNQYKYWNIRETIINSCYEYMIVYLQNTRASVIKLLIKLKELIKLLEYKNTHKINAFPFPSYK